MQTPQTMADAFGNLAFHLTEMQPIIPTYIHLIVSALFPVYTGAFSSLARPSSAAKPLKRKRRDGRVEEEEEDEGRIQRMEGLSPSDAIMFPLLAGATLTGLYFLIKWLNDPALLNRILNWYFATFSVFSVARLVSDGLDVLHSILFPHEFIDQGILFCVDARRCIAVPLQQDSPTSRSLPLPGPFSRLPLSQSLREFFWFLHIVPTRRLNFDVRIRSLLHLNLRLGIHGIEGLLVALSTVLYYNFVSKPWYLTNLMGLGFAYGALQLMSPTTFATGSLILGALFFYDIYFVFFTPMMVAVAKSLDIPIKLLFPRPSEPDEDPAKQALSMLGLGDVVLPGMLVGLALRFDLFLFYLREQTKALPKPEDAVGQSTKSTSMVDAKSKTVKAPYTPVCEGWGDTIWTSRLVTTLLSPTSEYPIKNVTPKATCNNSQHIKYTPRNSFPKPYFHASLLGYTLGMITTLAAMQISEHPQPALLYLVPGVVGSVWLTALGRGEIALAWSFSDAAEEEEESDEKRKANRGEEQKEKANGEESSKGKKAGEARRQGLFASLFSAKKADERSKRLQKALSGGAESGDRDEGKHEGHEGEGDVADVDWRKKLSRSGRSKTEGSVLFSFKVTAPLRLPLVDEEEGSDEEGDDTADDDTEDEAVGETDKDGAKAEPRDGLRRRSPRWKAPGADEERTAVRRSDRE